MATPFISPSYNGASFADRQVLVTAINSLIRGSFAVVSLDNTVTEPNVVNGSIAYSDGITWNPGSGAGFYMKLNNAWSLIRKADDNLFNTLSLTVRTSAPSPLSEGLIAFADGSSWNPGSGRGVYVYSSSAWHLIRFVDNVTFTGVVISNPSGTPTSTTGKIMFTSGSPWNPGKGAGVYVYYNSAWHLLRLEEDNGFMSLFMGTNTSAPSTGEGTIAFADGSSWNPGSGKGFYGYYNSAWHFLG